MDQDFDRYGDYNEVDEPPKKRSFALIAIRVLTVLLVVTVVGVLVFRMILSAYYPANIKGLVYTDALNAYVAENGTFTAKTQKLRASYDDPKFGNFFADHLIVLPEVGELQLSLRYNVAAMNDIADRYKTDLPDPDDPALLTFRLTDNYGKDYGTPVFTDTGSAFMYRYRKLVFDGIDFDGKGGNAPEWIRLEIFVAGQTKPYSYIAVYENNADYNTFEDYTDR